MAQTNVAPKFDDAKIASVDLDPKLMGQLNEILESVDSKDRDISYLYYSVPMAGVRYYSYEEPPSRPKAGQRASSQ